MPNLKMFFEPAGTSDAAVKNQILSEALYHLVGRNPIAHEPASGDVLITTTCDIYQCVGKVCNVPGLYAFVPLGCSEENTQFFYSHMGRKQRKKFFSPGAIANVIRERNGSPAIANEFLNEIHKLSFDKERIKQLSNQLPQPIPQVIN